MTVSERIAHHRKRLGLSQRQLAERVGLDTSAVGHWERAGGTSPRNLEHVVTAGLEMTMAEFYSDPAPAPAPSTDTSAAAG